MAAMMTVIGAISGTSMDGIDVAWIASDGVAVEPGPGRTYPYPAMLRQRLLALAADPQRAMGDGLASIEADVTKAHGDAIAQLLAEVPWRPLDLIGLHGQTIYHRPEQRFTRQLGDGAAIAKRFGVETVSDFRMADVAAGGEGAPFAPLYHVALARELDQPLVVLNWGGVGNVTYLDGALAIAFDTGPASALIDDFVKRRRGLSYDADGALAASGRVDLGVLAQLMDNPFFARPAPKSLDRNDFHARAAAVDRLSDADGAATLAAFTVAATAAAAHQFPKPVKRWLVTGGGRHNQHLMAGLAAAVGVPVEPVEAVGWQGDIIEAQCFGHLAVRSLHGLPLSLPTTTGVPQPMPGGVRHRP